ncbi:MAG: hypothetical protein JW782_02045 [Candidatus Saganbacteria bacterium]|nr:hypothetical protein [Candidatus Saganbacteria bacterium]
MSALIIKGLVSRYSRLRSLLPRLGAVRAERAVNAKNLTRISVGEAELEAAGAGLKWSRTCAMHLRNLGIAEIRAETPAELATILDLALHFRGRDSEVVELEALIDELVVGGFSHPSNIKKVIHHPLATREDILEIVNTYCYHLFKVIDEGTRREAFVKLKTFGPVDFSKLDPEIIPIILPEIEPVHHQELIKALIARLDGATMDGSGFIHIIKLLGKENDPEAVRAIASYHQREMEAAQQQQAANQSGDIDPEDYRGTGGTPSSQAGIPGSY